jgi:2'-hydroxyisoflavone reductase
MSFELSSLSRRRFLSTTAVAATAVAAGAAVPAFGRQPGAKAAPAAAGSAGGLRILVLGGTGFLGPAVVEAAQARGHKVTIFNRGRREKYFGSPENVEHLYGNRDPRKHSGFNVVDGKEVEDESSPLGLSELEGKKWDAVIDNSGYVPRIVKASAELLAPNVGQYLFVSSVSAYKSNEKAWEDESGEVGTMSDPTIEEMGKQFENYGPLKVLCEQAAENAMPGRVTNVRPGYIVGPGDTTDRFTYWPVRASKGGEMLCPGTPQDPVQFIDVRDLAEFMILCLEKKTVGLFNATGPDKEYTNGPLLEACRAASKATGGQDPTLTWVPYDFMEKNGLPAGSLPILLPSEGETAGFHRRSVAKAVAAGLKFRTAEETCTALLKWWPEALAERAAANEKVAKEDAETGRKRPTAPADRLRAGPPQEKEAEILAAWKKFKG